MIPLDIAFRDTDPSDFRIQLIREHLAELAQDYERIVRCHVAVEGPREDQRNGFGHRVKVQLHVPGIQLVTNEAQEVNLTQAIGNAFRASRRQLVRAAERQSS